MRGRRNQAAAKWLVSVMGGGQKRPLGGDPVEERQLAVQRDGEEHQPRNRVSGKREAHLRVKHKIGKDPCQ